MTFVEQLKNFFLDHSSGVFTEENYPGLLGAFNKAHIAVLCFAAVLIPLLCFLLRKADHKKIKTYLQVSAVVWIGLEIFKLIWILIVAGALYFFRQLPLQLCSIYLYALALSAWGKGKFKLAGDNFLASFGIIAGFFGLTFTSIFGLYPLIHFNAFHSMLYHISMMLAGCLLLSCGYVKLHYKNMVYSLLLVLATVVVAVVLNESGFGANFMYLRTGEATPLAIINFLPRAVYIFVVLLMVAVAHILPYVPSFAAEKRRRRSK